MAKALANGASEEDMDVDQDRPHAFASLHVRAAWIRESQAIFTAQAMDRKIDSPGSYVSLRSKRSSLPKLVQLQFETEAFLRIIQNIQDDVLRGNISGSAAGRRLERQYDCFSQQAVKVLGRRSKNGIVLPAQSLRRHPNIQPSSELDSYSTDDEEYYQPERQIWKADSSYDQLYHSDNDDPAEGRRRYRNRFNTRSLSRGRVFAGTASFPALGALAYAVTKKGRIKTTVITERRSQSRLP